jgi:hypothetical protein
MLAGTVMPGAPLQLCGLAWWLSLLHGAFMAASSWMVRRGPLPGTAYLTPAPDRKQK